MKRLVQLTGMGWIVALGVAGVAHAGYFEGRIEAHFESPVLQGYVSGSGQGWFDNRNRAVYNAWESGVTASLQWGSAPGFSQVNFFPNQNVATLHGQVFDFGSLTYYNGTSALESLIFGATLVLDFIPSGATQPVQTLSLGLGIGTTFNTGAASDADYISISGLDRSTFVNEGWGASFFLRGVIVDPGDLSSLRLFSVDDPYLLPTDVVLDPDTITRLNPDDPTQLETLTFPGSNIGLLAGSTGPTPIPEPSTLALVAIGFVTVVTAGHCRKRHRPAA